MAFQIREVLIEVSLRLQLNALRELLRLQIIELPNMKSGESIERLVF